ncbi:phage portal protein, lambda family [Burkholderia sp. MSHR3999]|uniref:phage portal protein n=1 Tax=Burkholderia sp. MSHR3999 TaxID=1542965 RepID=UPI0005ACF10F|nr:phage portal protein [Burkholderia sp. MSHR3999]KIP13956.1 phage portal protein, lambda family [Burkholderia sp. MSHR3999]
MDIQILDQHGVPISGADDRMTVQGAAFKSGERVSRELAHWRPSLKSADRDMLPEKAIVEGRAHDLSRNNGFARGALQSQKDRIVGANYRLQLRPAYKTLGLDFKTANDWAAQVEQEFSLYADDPECLIDATRRRTMTQMLRECVGTEMLQGEAILSREWRSSPAGYSTCFMSIEPERMCNRNLTMDVDKMRAGVELDAWGAPLAYWIRTRHQQDVDYGMSSYTWDRYPKYNRFGDLNIIHVFEPERPNQTRGFSQFASVIQKMKMVDRFEDVELEAAIIATTYAMVIKSEFGARSAMEALNGSPFHEQLGAFIKAQMAFHNGTNLTFDGIKIPHLFPNESLEFTTPNHPNANAESFRTWMMRHCARGMNTSYEEYTGDFSKTTYSSARASIDVAWKYVTGKRAGFVDRLASLMVRAWMDEAITRGRIKPPPGIDYWKARSALTRSAWIGAGKMVIDELKTAKANQTKLTTGETNLMNVTADNGDRWDEELEQRAREIAYMEELGLPKTDPYAGQADPETLAMLSVETE